MALRILGAPTGTYVQTSLSQIGAPTTGTHLTGEVFIDADGTIWACSAGGTPGTWSAAGGGGVAGVSSFNTRSGAVTLTKSDVTGTGLAAVDVGAAGSAAGTAGHPLAATDPTTTNARTPTAHAATHGAAGGDALTLTEAQITGLAADLAATEKTANKGTANGYASLDSGGHVPTAQLPAITMNTVWPGVASQAAMLALAAEPGDVAIRTDASANFMLAALPASTLANWAQLADVNSPVTSVFGRTGAVSGATGDYTAEQIGPSGVFDVAENLAEGVPATMRTNLGLGSAAVNNKVAAGLAGVLDATDPTTTNARTPTAHAATHELGGSDAVRLDQLAAPTAAVALNAQKITNLANGSVAGDAVAFGQLGSAAFQPTSAFDPSGSAAASIPLADVTTKGDLLAATGSAAVSRVAVGANNTVLVADSTQTAGVTYKDPYGLPQQINSQAGTTYTFVITDAGRLVICSNAAAVTVTVPPNSSVAYPIGTLLNVLQSGAGQVTVAAGAGVTINSPASLNLRAQWSIATLEKTNTDTWALNGDLQPLGESINAQTGTTYTFTASDANSLVTLSNAAAVTVTVPPNSSVAYQVGVHIDLAQTGAGQVTVAAGAGVTIHSSSTLLLRTQYSAATLIQTAANVWLLMGDLQ